MIESHAFQTRVATDSYTDLASLNSIRSLGREDKNKALEEVAKQFESMLVRMMMKSMRDANAVFAKDNMLSSPSVTLYQQMYDDQMALSLSQAKGLGLSEVMVKQLQRSYGEAKTNNGIQRNQTLMPHNPQPEKNTLTAVDKTSLVKPPAEKQQASFDGSVINFVSQLYSMAKEAAQKLNVKPSTLLAQSALETGWGKKITQSAEGDSSLNLFNIKAGNDWQGDSVNVLTLEFKNNLPVKERAYFRSYESLQQSFDDYVNFITGRSRYQQALNNDKSNSYISELAMAGYATDPEYAAKVTRIANSAPMKNAIASEEVN